MARYRKKPVVVEAVQVSFILAAAQQDWAQLPGWIKDAHGKGILRFDGDGSGVFITTLEGTMIGERADWIIRGVQGELYPCKPDIFAATYESAD